jgi:hypothetical protein
MFFGPRVRNRWGVCSPKTLQRGLNHTAGPGVRIVATNLPSRLPELVAWGAAHAPIFVSSASQIGLTSAQAVAFSELVDELQGAVEAANAAREASKAATLNQNDTADAFRALAGAYVNLIKAFAQVTDNPKVYTIAQISPDAPPSPAPAPVPPQEFTAGVNTSGSITLKWKVAQPAGVTGVSYLVKRRVNGSAGEFQFVGTSDGKKTFTDSTLPLGVDRVEYVVTPKRGPVAGADSPAFSIQFGSIAAPGAMPSITTSIAPMKLAA